MTTDTDHTPPVFAMSPNFAAPIPHAYANGGTGDAADLASVDSKAHLNLAASSLNSYPTEGAMSSTAGHQTLNGSLPGDQTPKALPKIGETRCCKSTLLSIDPADHCDRQ